MFILALDDACELLVLAYSAVGNIFVMVGSTWSSNKQNPAV